GFRQLGDEDARLRADEAAEGLAIGAVGTSRPPVVGARNDRAGRRERMQPDLAGAGVEQHAGLVEVQWWQRIFAGARRLEHVAAVDLAALQVAGLAGHAARVSAFARQVTGWRLRSGRVSWRWK